jgi:NDP-sugar pyrophosphorylase family protein
LIKSQSPIQIVIPMAGLGLRFQNEGVKTLKPLIPVKNIPMFVYAFESTAKFNSTKLHAVILKEHQERHALDKKLNRLYPDLELTILDSRTRGAAETILAASPQLKMDDPLLILDCDIAFNCEDLESMVNTGAFHAFDGVLLYFESQNPSYSYLEKDHDFICVRIIEKKVISNYAVIGAYFISTASNFFESAKQRIELYDEGRESEIYISSVINQMIEEGARFLTLKAEFVNFGTPEDLKRYNQENQN